MRFYRVNVAGGGANKYGNLCGFVAQLYFQRKHVKLSQLCEKGLSKFLPLTFYLKISTTVLDFLAN